MIVKLRVNESVIYCSIVRASKSQRRSSGLGANNMGAPIRQWPQASKPVPHLVRTLLNISIQQRNVASYFAQVILMSMNTGEPLSEFVLALISKGLTFARRLSEMER